MNSPNIDEFQVSFYILGGDISPSEITQHLQIQPDLIQVKGELRPAPHGQPRQQYLEHLWRFSSPQIPNDDQEVGRYIEFILQAIEPHADFLLRLSTNVNLCLEIVCCLDERFRSTSYPVDVALLARLVKLRVGMGHVFRLATNENSLQ